MFLTRLINLLPMLLGIGTLLGKDPTFNARKTRDIGPFVVAELSAGDRQTLRNMAMSYSADNELSNQEKENKFFDLRLQAIAATARNKNGYFLFNPMSVKDMQKIAGYPSTVLENALDAIAEISSEPFLRATPAPEADTENPS